jgi:hypothetical protein
MVERRRGPQDVLELARGIAGSPTQLVIDMYDRHRAQFYQAEYHGEAATEKFKAVMMSEIRYFLTSEDRACFFAKICDNLITHVNAAQKEKREERVNAIVIAFSHYALLCRWVEEVAQELEPPLTHDEQSAITAFQQIVYRLP